jgi:hypothetical protein
MSDPPGSAAVSSFVSVQNNATLRHGELNGLSTSSKPEEVSHLFTALLATRSV